MPFILSNIRSITRGTDLNKAERQQQSTSNIAQHPRYRKAILRISKFNYYLYDVRYLITIHSSFIPYYITLDKFPHCRPGLEQYD